MVPVVCAVSVTVVDGEVLSVATNDVPAVSVSLAVPTTVMVSPALYDPSAEELLKAVMVGAVVSIVKLSADDVDSTLEDSRIVVDLAVAENVPAVSAVVVQDQSPVVSLVAVHVPLAAPLMKSCIEEPTGAVPENVRVVFLVMSSELEAPRESDETSRSGVEVPGSAYRMMTTPDPPFPPKPWPLPEATASQ